MSPTIDPSRTSTIDGGMIWPSVPDVAITPVESSLEYPARSMVGREISPMVTTVAPTIPVEAASRAPTSTTDTARPPGMPPNRRPMEVSSSSAIFERSSAIPIRTNSGTAAVSFWFSPKAREKLLFPHSARVSRPFTHAGRQISDDARQGADRPPPRTPPAANPVLNR